MKGRFPQSMKPCVWLVVPLLLPIVWPAPAHAQDPDQLALGPPHETLLELGQLPPSAFSLESIDGDVYDLAAARGERPLLLLFFRGTW